MTWSAVAALLLFVTTMLGAALWGALSFRGEQVASRVRRIVKDSTAKNLAELLFWVSGSPVLGAKYLSGGESAWSSAVFWGSLSALVWKLSQQRLEASLGELDKLAKALDAEQTQRAENTIRGQSFLIDGIRSGVEHRLSQVLDALAAKSKSATLARVQEVLAPFSAVRDQLVRLASALQKQSPTSPQKPNIRVGLYLLRDNHMVPVAGVDLRQPGYNPFKSYEAHRAAYECRETKDSAHVVRCVLHRSMIVVEDCIEAAEKTEFSFTHEAQRSYLRSMVAYHLGEVVDQGGASVDAVIAADSNCAGVFKDSADELLEDVLEEFGLRIRLEMALQELLTRGKGVA